MSFNKSGETNKSGESSRQVKTPSFKWPVLDYQACADTYATLHRFIQIIGKIKMANSPWTNHSWHTTLAVTPLGLSTGPFMADGKSVSIEFDFSNHSVVFSTSDGLKISQPLRSTSVGNFYQEMKKTMAFLGIKATFDLRPSELAGSPNFDKDETHRTYNPFHVADLWQALSLMDLVFKQFRSRFSGKSSPVHFFWGSFDLALTWFSGRMAPEHPGGFPNLPDLVVKEAYSHEVVSFGFFPGNEMYPKAAFYSYAYPEPEGFSKSRISPKSAFYNQEMGEYLLNYEDVIKSQDPQAVILEFFESCYQAAAELGKWEVEQFEGSRYLKELKQERDPNLLH